MPEITQFKGHRLWLHTQKIKYWQKLPSQFKGITHLGKELKVKTGVHDWNFDQILIVWQSREGGTVKKSKMHTEASVI